VGERKRRGVQDPHPDATAEQLRKLHADAAQAAAATREAGRRIFVYTGQLMPVYQGKSMDLLGTAAHEHQDLAAIIEGIESQGWRLEHVVFTNRYTMFFRRLLG
jgi:hypothetical protein